MNSKCAYITRPCVTWSVISTPSFMCLFLTSLTLVFSFNVFYFLKGIMLCTFKSAVSIVWKTLYHCHHHFPPCLLVTFHLVGLCLNTTFPDLLPQYTNLILSCSFPIIFTSFITYCGCRIDDDSLRLEC